MTTCSEIALRFAGAAVAVLASGPSMGAEVVSAVRRAGLPSIAVNTTYRLMPDADMLYAADWEWWNGHPDALCFAGFKAVGRVCDLPGVEVVPPRTLGERANSALHAAQFAEAMGAARIFLFGVDLRDDAATHWHGDHPAGLNNPSPDVFAHHRHGWADFAAVARVPIINCNLASGLDCFPRQEFASPKAVAA